MDNLKDGINIFDEKENRISSFPAEYVFTKWSGPWKEHNITISKSAYKKMFNDLVDAYREKKLNELNNLNEQIQELNNKYKDVSKELELLDKIQEEYHSI